MSKIPRNSIIDPLKFDDTINMFAAMFKELDTDPKNTYEMYQEYAYSTEGDLEKMFTNPNIKNEYNLSVSQKEDSFSRVKAKSKNQTFNRR